MAELKLTGQVSSRHNDAGRPLMPDVAEWRGLIISAAGPAQPSPPPNIGSETDLLNLIELMPMPMAVTDGQLVPVFANRAWIAALVESEAHDARHLRDLPECYRVAACSEHGLRAIRDGVEQLLSQATPSFVHRYIALRGTRASTVLHARRLAGSGPHLLFCFHETAEPPNETLLRGQQAAILRAEEEERRRIARELHDETFQQLALIRFGLESARTATQKQEFETAFLAIETALAAVQYQVRTLSYVLHPPELHRGGLQSALESFIRGFGRRSGLAVEFHDEAGFVESAPDVELALYRVAQEALANVLKHAQASCVAVRLRRDARRLVLEIRDDGIGIPLRVVHGEEPVVLGVGLASMRERMEALSGDLSVSRLDPGTLVSASVPRRRRRFR